MGNGKEFIFEESSYAEFLEHFKTVEERVAYLEELDKKMEFQRKRDEIENRKFKEESNQRWQQIEKHLAQIEKHLAHVTKLTSIVFDDLDFIGEQGQEISQRLRRKQI